MPTDPAPLPRLAARASPHVFRVRMVTWGMAGLLAGLVAAFVVQVGSFRGAVPPRPAGAGEAPSQGQVTVNRPHFTGFDRKNQPYVVNAASAHQDGEEPAKVHLADVKGEIKLAGAGNLLVVSARKALYNGDAKSLELDGNVVLVSTNRYTARIERVQVNLDSKRMRSESPVTVTFSGGHIQANGLEIWDDGKRILFFNRVKANFSGSGGKGDAG